MGTDVDWRKIRQEYIRGGVTYKKLSERYGVSIDRLKKRASEEGWKDAKKGVSTKVAQKVIEKVAEREAEEQINYMDVMQYTAACYADSLKSLVSAIKTAPENLIADLGDTSSLARAIKTNIESLMLAYGIKSPMEIEKLRLERERLEFEKLKWQTEQDAKKAAEQIAGSQGEKWVIELDDEEVKLDE